MRDRAMVSVMHIPGQGHISWPFGLDRMRSLSTAEHDLCSIQMELCIGAFHI